VSLKLQPDKALIFRVTHVDNLPPHGLLGTVCYDNDTAAHLRQQIAEQDLDLTVHAKPGWYF
jgi:hypothetical protein